MVILCLINFQKIEIPFYDTKLSKNCLKFLEIAEASVGKKSCKHHVQIFKVFLFKSILKEVCQIKLLSIFHFGGWKKLTKMLSHLYSPSVLKNSKLFHFIWMKLASFRMICSKNISMCVMCRKNKIKLTSERVFSLYGILLNCLKTYYCKCTNSWERMAADFFALSSCFKTSTWTITSSIAMHCQVPTVL